MSLALWWHGPNDLRLEQAPDLGPPGPGEAIVRVAWCGICGSDLSEYRHGPVMIRSGPHPLTGEAPPLVLGHEFSGYVEEVGADVDVEPGTPVAVDPCWRCGTCYWCTIGDYHLCRDGGAVGLASHGGLAPRVRVPAVGLVPLPPDLDLRFAALAEPLAVALHAIDRGGVKPGSRLLITGFGPIGAAVLLASRAAGATWIAVSEPMPERRARASELGADLVLDPADDDVRRAVFSATQRVGPDVTLECSGSAAALETALSSVRRGGVTVAVGIGHGAASIQHRQLIPFERSLVGTIGYRHDLSRAIGLLSSGQIEGQKLITAEVALDSAIHGAFDRLAAPNADLKILIRVGGDAR